MKDRIEPNASNKPDRPEQEKPGYRLQNIDSIQDGTQDQENNGTTHRGFKPRHSQMIAIGGAIGTSLFLGTGQVLRTGGPAFLLASYGIMSVLVYGIVTGIAEVATYLPVPGGTMSYYANKYVSRSLGFALGYLYWYSLGILVPYELVASTLLIGFWDSGPAVVSPAVWISVILAAIVLLNFLPVRFFGEAEFWSAGMKIVLILILILLSVVLFFGGGPDRDRLGFRYWRDPGPVNTYILEGHAGRFVALLQSLVLASFAFVLAPEQLIVTAGEMQSPRHNLPRAARRYVWRLIILFMPTVVGVGVVCPSDDPGLSASGTAGSPFVIAVQNAGIPVLDGVINALVLVSACTAGNAFLYSASRNLYSLAVAGNAPAVFKSLSSTSLTAFNWLINITNSAGFISWICCGWVCFRYQRAIEVHGLGSPYKSRVQPWGMWFGTVGAVFLLLINGFQAFLPGQWSVGGFLTAYVGIPVFLGIYLGHRACHHQDDWFRDVRDIDMREGLDDGLAAERPPPTRRGLSELVHVLNE